MLIKSTLVRNENNNYDELNINYVLTVFTEYINFRENYMFELFKFNNFTF